MGQIPASGHGEYTYPNGKYCGNFLNYKREGLGKMTFSDTKTAEGTWKIDEFIKCQMTFSNAKTAEGTWKNDEFIKGKMTYLNGDVYEGEFLNFQRHGQGVLQYPDGSIYEGEWEHDGQHGHGKLNIKDGHEIFEGNWKDGRPHGYFTSQYKNGKEMHTKYKNGELNMAECKIIVKIPQEKTVADIPLLTRYLLDPLIVDGKTPCFDLTFEGSIEFQKSNIIPVEGDLYIPGVFQFSGKWRNGLLNCKSIIYDTKEKMMKEIHFIDGVEIPINKTN